MKNNTSTCDSCKYKNNQAWDYPCPTCKGGSNYFPQPINEHFDKEGVVTSKPIKSNYKCRFSVWVAASISSLMIVAAKIALMTAIIAVSDEFIFHNFKSFEDIVVVSALLALFIEQVNTEYQAMHPQIKSAFKELFQK